jgi:hypothetical protein
MTQEMVAEQSIGGKSCSGKIKPNLLQKTNGIEIVFMEETAKKK